MNIQKKILVIGSNSFSGSHFVAEALLSGSMVWGVSRSPEPIPEFLAYRSDNEILSGDHLKNFIFKSIDLNKDLPQLFELIDQIHPEIIVNFAAQGMVAESWLNPSHWYKTNILSQVVLHDELRKKKYIEKYVHVTTPEVYGSTKGEWIKENTNFSPSTPYAVSRAACDLHLLSFYKAYEFPVVFTRAANVYGPSQQLYRIIPRAILTALSGKKMDLHGGGHSIRSFIHIKDVVRATLKLAINAEPGTTWHLSTFESFSIKEIVEKIFLLTGANFNELVTITEDRLAKDQSYLLDSSSMRETHNWSEKITIDQGLKDTLSWVESNFKLFETLPWRYQHKS